MDDSESNMAQYSTVAADNVHGEIENFQQKDSKKKCGSHENETTWIVEQGRHDGVRRSGEPSPPAWPRLHR